MNKKMTLAAAAVLASLMLVATSWAAKPGPDATLTLAVSPTTVKFGKPATVSGAISSKAAGVQLVLEYDAFPFDGKYTDTGTTTTGADGTYSYTVTPPTSTRYRVVTVDKPKITSPEGTLLVRWNISLGVSDKTPKKGTRVRFSGAVKPALPNGLVAIQRRVGDIWKTVKQTTMVTGDVNQTNYSVKVRVRNTGRYRSVVLGDGAHETGVSVSRRIVVH
ncbi:MAG: hypothetical protein ACJ762_09600 [Solirubrobacteraceae bacterium]